VEQISNIEDTLLESLDHWSPLETFVENNPQFTMSQMRHQLRHREKTGFDKVVCKFGKKFYIHDVMFARYLMAKKG